MSINDDKAALKNIIEAMDDEAILQRWKTLLQGELEQYRQQHSTPSPSTSVAESATNTNSSQDDTSGYSILESGLGIDE